MGSTRKPHRVEVCFAPRPASQTSGTVVPKRLFMGAAANGWVEWKNEPAARRDVDGDDRVKARHSSVD